MANKELCNDVAVVERNTFIRIANQTVIKDRDDDSAAAGGKLLNWPRRNPEQTAKHRIVRKGDPIQNATKLLNGNRKSAIVIHFYAN